MTEWSSDVGSFLISFLLVPSVGSVSCLFPSGSSLLDVVSFGQCLTELCFHSCSDSCFLFPHFMGFRFHLISLTLCLQLHVNTVIREKEKRNKQTKLTDANVWMKIASLFKVNLQFPLGRKSVENVSGQKLRLSSSSSSVSVSGDGDDDDDDGSDGDGEGSLFTVTK